MREIFEKNRRWAAAKSAADPEFFSRLAAGQSPKLLWIGCADSRVAADQITGLAPGEIFVHRNVANLIHQTDMNALSVLQFAVEVLHVTDIIVCGHYGCGGVAAAMSDKKHGLIDNWLRSVREVYRQHRARVDAVADPGKRADLLCELNVAQQVANLHDTTIIQDAWGRGQEISLHGWVYRLTDGLLHDLGLTVSGPSDPS